MRTCAALCLGAVALTPVFSLKLTEVSDEASQTLNPKPLPDASAAQGLGFDVAPTTQQQTPAEIRAVDTAADAELFAAAAAAADEAAAAAAAADEAAAAAAAAAADEAAAAAADEAAALAAATEAEAEKTQQETTHDTRQRYPAVFAPRRFRFVDAENGRALNVFFHNAFEPFDTIGCSDLRSSLSVCTEHPRCSVLSTYEGSEACGLSKEYLSLLASTLCSRTSERAAAPRVEANEMRAVVADLLIELGVEPQPLLAELDAADAADAESLCGLAQELATEILATERSTKAPTPDADSQTTNPNEGLVEGLLESSLGFIAGGTHTPSASGSPKLRNPRPHNALATDEQKPSTATLLRASESTPGSERIRLGINGFGRIGRLVFRIAANRPGMAVTHINSSMSPEYLAYMLKYDSAHGRFPGQVEVKDGNLFVNNKRIHLTSSRDPKEINWEASGTDFVCESTGAFCYLKDAAQHVDRPGGALHVVISAPAKDEETPTLVVGVNAEAAYTPEMKVVSCASCTTNGLAPLVKVIDSNFGIEEGLMTTVHAVTGTQRVVDMSSNKDWRGGRAAGFNIIPSSTGAAKAVARCLPQMKGKLTGMAFRVPTLDVSVVDLTCRLKQSTSYEDIKAAIKAAAEGEMRGILGFTEEAVVSSDIMGSECSSVFDANAGIMLNPNFVKLVSWYDNEFAYSARLVDLVAIMAAKDGLVPEGTGLNRKPF